MAAEYAIQIRDGIYFVTYPDGSADWRIEPVPQKVIKYGDLSTGYPGDITRGVFFLLAADGEMWVYHSGQRRLVGKHPAIKKADAPSNTAGPCFAMTPGPLDEQGTASSWLGGVPCLPAGLDWPMIGDRGGFFLGQIACGDVPPGAWGGRGPRDGMLAIFAGAETPGVRLLYFETPGPASVPPPDVDGYVMDLGRLGERPPRRSVHLGPWEEEIGRVGVPGHRKSADMRERIRIGGPHYYYNSGSDGSGYLVLFDFPTSHLFGWSFSDADRLVILTKPDALERRDFDAVDFDYAAMDAAYLS